jgi:hypothetical protein
LVHRELLKGRERKENDGLGKLWDMQRLNQAGPGFSLAGSGNFYRSDRYDMWHNVAMPQGHVN